LSEVFPRATLGLEASHAQPVINNNQFLRGNMSNHFVIDRAGIADDFGSGLTDKLHAECSSQVVSGSKILVHKLARVPNMWESQQLGQDGPQWRIDRVCVD